MTNEQASKSDSFAQRASGEAFVQCASATPSSGARGRGLDAQNTFEAVPDAPLTSFHLSCSGVRGA
jgi:hypothetical protein